jgi:DNA-binding PadR family transcriptional regulator
VSNLLALAVLALLGQRPMHPYEMGRTMRERRIERSIKLNYGSLYTVVDQLTRAGFVRPRETVRDSQRPERTVYALTDAGRDELRDWMRELVGTWHKEFLEFEAALALIVVLPPDEVVPLLRRRAGQLDHQIDEVAEGMHAARERGVERLFLIEDEYRLALWRAELAFVESFLEVIENDVPDLGLLWAQLHKGEAR